VGFYSLYKQDLSFCLVLVQAVRKFDGRIGSLEGRFFSLSFRFILTNMLLIQLLLALSRSHLYSLAVKLIDLCFVELLSGNGHVGVI
jgi:hypothetical protein